MNPKPYGWHCFIGKGKEEQDFLFINGKGSSMPDASWDKVIPLYTHPADLTDEEIIKVYENMLGVASARSSAIDFARAILRKAQEK